jgi:hypothetical protein
MMHGHNVHLIKCTRTRRAFAHTIADAIINALIAKQVAARLQGCILEIVTTDRA